MPPPAGSPRLVPHDLAAEADLRYRALTHLRFAFETPAPAVGAHAVAAAGIAEEFGCPAGPVAETLRPLAGRPAARPALEAVAWRLAGNLPALRRGRPVPLAPAVRAWEWAPAQVTAARRGRRGEHAGADLAVRFLAGGPAGASAELWWPKRLAWSYARRLGFSRRARPAPLRFVAPEELTNLRFYALLPPSPPGGPFEPTEIRVTPTLAAWNRTLLARRKRTDRRYPCPRGRTSAEPCWECPDGYRTCPAGVRRLDLVYRPCRRCGDPGAPFDPDDPEACVECRRRAAGW